jgi:hypothetical protein
MSEHIRKRVPQIVEDKVSFFLNHLGLTRCIINILNFN